MPAINENLKLLRQANGMTQADVADIISVTRQTISSYESGRTQPDLETLKRFAEVYKVDLYDVLYGGNHLQRRLKKVKLAVIIPVAILLFGILAHSVLYWTIDHFFVVNSGTVITPDNISSIETRFALRDLADSISRACSAIFTIGCLAMIYPSITIIHSISYRKILAIFFAIIIAMFACTIPFAVTDEIYEVTDYLLPILNDLIIIPVFLIILSAKFIKQRRRSRGGNN